MLENYKNKKVFVTGDSGFKGTWLCLWLHKLGAKVFGYSLYPNTINELHYQQLELDKKITHFSGDVRDLKYLDQCIKQSEPEIVFHLAAQPFVGAGFEFPHETFSTNFMGTLNLLEVCKKTSSVKSIVVVTSDKSYKNQDWISMYREGDTLSSGDPYSASKAASEIVTESYSTSFFKNKVGVATARSGNTIGGGDWSESRLIPKTIKLISENKPATLYDPEATRPWTYVIDIIHGYMLLGLKLLENPAFFTGAWNFGPDYDSNVTVLEIVKKIIHFSGKGEYIITGESYKESKYLSVDSSKSRHFLHWKPMFKFEDMLELTVKWYLNRNIDSEIYLPT